MNEQKTAVLTDSSCDVAPEFLQKYPEIHVLPMHIMYPEKDYLDGVDIDPLMTYRRFPAEFPSTSTPNIGEVQEMIERIRQEGYEKNEIKEDVDIQGTFLGRFFKKDE